MDTTTVDLGDFVNQLSYAAANLLYEEASKLKLRSEYQLLELMAEKVQGEIVYRGAELMNRERLSSAADACEDCGETAWPIGFSLDGPSLRAAYRCDRCEWEWSTYWAADFVEGLSG